MKNVLSLIVIAVMLSVMVAGTTMAAGLDQAVAKGKVTIVGSPKDPVGLVIWNEKSKSWTKQYELTEVKLENGNTVENSFLLTRIKSTTFPKTLDVAEADMIALSEVSVGATVSDPKLASQVYVLLTVGEREVDETYSWYGTLYDLSQGAFPNFKVDGKKKVNVSMSAINSQINGQFTYDLNFTVVR